MNGCVISSKIEIREDIWLGKGFYAKEDIQPREELMAVMDDTFITCDMYSERF